jgi:hypothetical protein
MHVGHFSLETFDLFQVKESTRTRAFFAVDVAEMCIPVTTELVATQPAKVTPTRACHLVATFVFDNASTTCRTQATFLRHVRLRSRICEVFSIFSERLGRHLLITHPACFEHSELLLRV